MTVQETKGQDALPENHHQAQPERDPTSSALQPQATESSAEDDRLFSIELRSKKALRKASRYRKQSDPSPLSGGQELTLSISSEPSCPVSETSFRQAEEQPKQSQKFGYTVGDRTGKTKRGRTPRDRAEKRTQRIERLAQNAKEQERKRDERPEWLKQKLALKEKFPEGWRPPKRLSPDALEGIRVLHQQFPGMYTTEALAKKFEVSPEAIRRILRAKWEPTAEEEEDRQQRWFRRGVSVWQRYAELGREPPRRWREAGVQSSPWQEARPRRENHAGEEGGADKVDPETATRLQAQVKLSQSLV